MVSRSREFIQTYGKAISIFLMLALGALIPQAHQLSFLIQYLLMIMLFFTFLDVNLKPEKFPKSVIWILLVNAVIAFLGFGLFARNNLTLALVAFIIGIAPSAISAPIVIGFIGGQVEYVLAAVFLTNLTSAIIIPLALPTLMGTAIPISLWDVFQSAIILMIIPLILAQLAIRLPAKVQPVIRKGKLLTFPLWIFSLFLIGAKISDFIRNGNIGSLSILFYIALISLVICVINFTLGAVIGGHQFRREASQSLGHKNLGYIIWIALTFINPLVALGPTFYILYHHLYNSWLFYRFEKQRSQI